MTSSLSTKSKLTTQFSLREIAYTVLRSSSNHRSSVYRHLGRWVTVQEPSGWRHKWRQQCSRVLCRVETTQHLNKGQDENKGGINASTSLHKSPGEVWPLHHYTGLGNGKDKRLCYAHGDRDHQNLNLNRAGTRDTGRGVITGTNGEPRYCPTIPASL